MKKILVILLLIPVFLFAKTNNLTKNKPAVEIQLLRNATMKITYNNKTILTDPLLADKNSYYGYLDGTKLVNPTSDLTVSVNDILKGIDAVLVSHTHIPASGKLDLAFSDHFDEKAIEVLNKNIPLLVQPIDAEGLKKSGFNNIKSIEKEMAWNGISIERFDVKHMDIDSLLPMVGGSSGYVLRAKNNPTILWAGDTVITEELKKKIIETKPDIIIIHPAEAQVPLSLEMKENFGKMGMPVDKNVNKFTLLMGVEGAIEIAKLAPNAKIISVHLESIDHCPVTRDELKKAAKNAGVKNIIVPENGEILSF